MPVCGRCGEDNPERARFCLACASPLAAAPATRREERKRVSVLEHGAQAASPYWPGELTIVLRGLGRAGELVELAATVATPTPWLQTAAAIAAGRRAGGTAQLQRALAFYREVRATAYLREGEALLTASA